SDETDTKPRYVIDQSSRERASAALRVSGSRSTRMSGFTLTKSYAMNTARSGKAINQTSVKYQKWQTAARAMLTLHIEGTKQVNGTKTDTATRTRSISYRLPSERSEGRTSTDVGVSRWSSDLATEMTST